MKEKPGSTILILEQQFIIAEHMRVSLMNAGYEAVIFRTFREAQRAIRSLEPDLLVIGSLLKTDGLSRTAVAKKLLLASAHTFPVLFVSSKALPLDPLFSRQATLRKPFTEEELNEAVSNILQPTNAPNNTEH